MTYRLLSPDEHGRLAGHQWLTDGVPDGASVVVAEDASGVLCGFWCLTPVLHIEPVWIAPEHRSGVVGTRLFEAVSTLLDSVSVPVAYCFADRPEVSDYLSRLGLTFLPYSVHQLCLKSPPRESSKLPPPPSSPADSVCSVTASPAPKKTSSAAN